MDEQYLSIYSNLVQMLREMELHETVRSVERTIRLGKSVEKSIRDNSGSRRRQIDIVGYEEYSSKERLEILVDAIECSVIGRVRVQQSVRSFFEIEREREIARLRQAELLIDDFDIEDFHDNFIVFFSEEDNETEYYASVRIISDEIDEFVESLQELINQVKEVLQIEENE